jgi:DNA-binding MarR family transcriptional regulator
LRIHRGTTHQRLKSLSSREYRALAAFRQEIRRFLEFSERAARTEGVEPGQHQLLLVLKGLHEGERPTIGAVSQFLLVKHYTAVGLVTRAEELGLVAREKSIDDRREVLVSVTEAGDQLLDRLARAHRDELRYVGPRLVEALAAVRS